jgi:hypothetical protein
MKKLYFKCPYCGKEYLFEKTDLPAGFISPNDLNENKMSLLAVECQNPECNQSTICTPEDVKKALETPELPKPPKVTWEWFWKE